MNEKMLFDTGSSGPFIPPYQYNGFWAKLHFQHVLLDDATANASGKCTNEKSIA